MEQHFIQQRLISSSHRSGSNDDKNSTNDKALIEYLQKKETHSKVAFRKASVLIPLVRNKEKIHWDVILTKRSIHLKHHPGEISFPGGRFEKSDKDLLTTAKRETQEEIGIEPSQIQIIGQLPSQKTISGYLVTPFVGIIDPSYQLCIDRNEVEEAFLAPLSFMLAPSNQNKTERNLGEQSFSYYVIKYKQYNIWGATARMMVNLSRVLKK